MPDEFRKKIFWQKSETVFRFGNNGTLSSLGAVFLPFRRQWLKIEVVDGTTPFLLSNAFLKAVTADICTSKRLLSMFQGKVSVPLEVSDKGLFLVDLTKILKHAQKNLLHGDTWEVVTNLTDEGTVTREERTQEKPLDTCTAPAATQPSSTVESTSRSPTSHGAQEGEPSLCGHIQCGHASSVSGRPHVEHVARSRRDQHRETTGHSDPQAMGEEILAGGKRVGKTFAEARALDASYAHFMVKKGDCTSAWAKSFHNYLKAMEQVSSRPQADQRPIMTASAAAMVKKNWAKNGAIATDWDVVDELKSQQSAEVPKGITSVASWSKAKRGPPASGDPWAMQTEMSYEASLRVEQLQTQIAILQDEMSRLLPSAEEDA